MRSTKSKQVYRAYSPRLSHSYRHRTFWAAGTILRLGARLFQFDQALFMACEADRIGNRFQNPDEHALVSSWRFRRSRPPRTIACSSRVPTSSYRERAGDRLPLQIHAPCSGRPSGPAPMPGSDSRETGTSRSRRPPRGRAFRPSSWLGIDYGCVFFSHSSLSTFISA
jgi:hypothetical protein